MWSPRAQEQVNIGMYQYPGQLSMASFYPQAGYLPLDHNSKFVMPSCFPCVGLNMNHK